MSPWLAMLMVGLAAQLLFSWALDRPGKLVFDETHYVPAARTLLALEEPANPEHPLLAKELIATGIALAGDTPAGWRIFSTLAGTASVLAVFAILWIGFGRLRMAVVGAVLAMLNQLLYVHARLGMQEAFLGAFALWGVAMLLWAMRASPALVRTRLGIAGVLFGLAVAVKWAAVPQLGIAGLGVLWLRWRDRALPIDHPERRWRGMTTPGIVLLVAVTSIAAYLLTFTPAFFYARDPMTLARLLPFQWEMYQLQTQILTPHPYQSSWWQWPLILRPIWYFYEPDNGIQRGVLLVGNPAIMWSGLVAVAACLAGDGRMRAIAIWYLASLGTWAIIPKSLGFYYYYHVPALILCLALAAALDRFARPRWRYADLAFLAVAAALFVWFFPILSGAPLPDAQAFNHWMWLDSWR